MKHYFKIMLFSLLFCIGTQQTEAQTSYGDLIQGNAGNAGNNSDSYFGYEAGINSNGSYNTFIGYRSGSDATGNAGTFVGTNSGRNNTGYGNNFLGASSGLNNTSGGNNTFLGTASGYNNTIGSYNNFMGFSSGSNNESGNYNIFIGHYSGHENISGADNTFIGARSGLNNETGSGNVFLGNRAGFNEMGSNRLYIDNSSTSNPLIWGNFSTNQLNFNGSVGIGTETPTAPLHIVTTIHDGTPNVAGTQISQGRIELTRSASNPYIDFQNDQGGTDYDARILLNGDNDLSIYGANLNMQDNEIQNVRELKLRDYDDNTGGTDNKYRVLARDGAFQFYNGGVVVGNYGNGTWTDLNNGRLIVEDRIGIGTTSPQADLHVNGTARITNISQNNTLTRVLVEDADGDIFWRDATSLGNNNDFPSYPASAGNGGGDNTNSFFGASAGSDTGANNTFVGYQSGDNNTGNDNSSLGSRTLEHNTTGERNTANGAYALFENTSGIQNTAIGYTALGYNSEGNNNTAIGYLALRGSFTPESNTGDSNVAVGHQAILSNETGIGNAALGRDALYSNISGDNNIAIGREALGINTTGSRNIAIGDYSGPQGAMNTDLINTITLGSSAHAEANNATAIGHLALATALNSIAIGSGASAGGENSVAIGDGAVINVDNEMVLGNLSTTHIRANVIGFSPISDARFKTNVKENIPGLEFITKLRPVSYQIERTKLHQFLTGKEAPNTVKNDLSMGFIAQEVEQMVEENGYIFTGIKKPVNEKDHYGLRYVEFIMPLVKSVKELNAENNEQKQRIEALEQEIEALKAMVYGDENTAPSTKVIGLKEGTTHSKEFALAQNTPNPFDKTTTISVTVPETVRQAKIVVYNLNGLELASYDINGSGKTSVAISGGSLPSGMYLYALVADGQIIDTKKMILTK